MIVGHLIVSATTPISVYLRAHKKEPIAHLSFAAGILTLLISYYFCKQYGVIGIGAGFMLSQMIVFPLIILVYQKKRLDFEKAEFE